MHHFIFNLADGDRDRAKSFLHAKRWVVNREGHHRDALAPGDLALVLVALTREFVGRVELQDHVSRSNGLGSRHLRSRW